MDFVAYASACKWASMRLDRIETVDSDLAIDGVRISPAPGEVALFGLGMICGVIGKVKNSRTPMALRAKSLSRTASRGGLENASKRPRALQVLRAAFKNADTRTRANDETGKTLSVTADR